MSNGIIEYGLTRPQWADDQFRKWFTAHCSGINKEAVIMPNEETAREMFTALIKISSNRCLKLE